MEKTRKMMPIGPLMIEHRLIERMIRQITRELERIGRTGEADIPFLQGAVEFIRVYADHCHHGKEENILFRELDKKDIPPEERRIMEELIEDHIYGRSKVAEIVAGMAQYTAGDATALASIVAALTELIEFYPKHIEKEDRHFFLPVMAHFTAVEKDAMLREGIDFDAGLIHEHYRRAVEELEKSPAR